LGNKWRYAVVGNIKKTHIDENGILRYGTAALKGNSRVYIYGKNLEERLPDRDMSEITVLGISRSRREYFDTVPVELIENVRLTRVYKPRILELMSNFEYADGWWGCSQEARNDASAFVRWWKKTYKTE